MKVTYRSVVIGLLLTPLTCMWLELCEFQWYSGSPTSISLYSHVMVILCLIAVSNEVVRRCRPAWALQSGEMIVIYVMLSLASSIGGHDMLQVLLPSMTHLHYFGPLEGRYEEFVGLVPPWLIVRDQTAIASAYMGQESVFRMANALPWLVPLGWWFLFVMALCAVMWGLLLAFRAQWTEHEKLAFPITQTPMLVAGAPRRLVRSRAFWVAFLLTGGIDILNGNIAGIAPPQSSTDYDEPLDLCGRTVGVETGSATVTAADRVAEECTSAGKPALEVDVFPQAAPMMVALQSKRIDVALNDAVVAHHLASIEPTKYAVVLEAVGTPFLYGFAVKKDEQAFAELVAETVNELIADGTYAQICEKYGVTGALLIDKSTVNGGTTSSESM